MQLEVVGERRWSTTVETANYCLKTTKYGKAHYAAHSSFPIVACLQALRKQDCFEKFFGVEFGFPILEHLCVTFSKTFQRV